MEEVPNPKMMRLLLALLIVCLALPTLAAEACAPQPSQPAMATHGHHAPQAPDDREQTPGDSRQHVCIGCVPPLTLPAVGNSPILIARPPAGEVLALDLAPSYGPAPPPPRRSA